MFQSESQAFKLFLGGSDKPKFKVIMIFMIMGIISAGLLIPTVSHTLTVRDRPGYPMKNKRAYRALQSS